MDFFIEIRINNLIYALQANMIDYKMFRNKIYEIIMELNKVKYEEYQKIA